jgi:hypothetical protein
MPPYARFVLHARHSCPLLPATHRPLSHPHSFAYLRYPHRQFVLECCLRHTLHPLRYLHDDASGVFLHVNPSDCPILWATTARETAVAKHNGRDRASSAVHFNGTTGAANGTTDAARAHGQEFWDRVVAPEHSAQDASAACLKVSAREMEALQNTSKEEAMLE